MSQRLNDSGGKGQQRRIAPPTYMNSTERNRSRITTLNTEMRALCVQYDECRYLVTVSVQEQTMYPICLFMFYAKKASALNIS